MGLWRSLSRLCFAYLLFLIFMTYQTPENGRQLLTIFDESLNVSLSKSLNGYHDTCELSWSHVSQKVDHYVVAHCVNWFMAALICRDSYVLVGWQLWDEIIELSFQHKIPHLNECWWDHIILDICLSNLPFLFLGLMVIDRLKIQRYDWLGRLDHQNRTIPITEWKIFRCHRYMNALINMILIVTVNFMCGFYIVANLWIAPKSYLNKVRLGVWFIMGNLAFKETYVDVVTWNTEQRIHQSVSGQFRWLLASVLCTETIMCYKFRKDGANIQDTPTPLYISIPWILGWVILYSHYFYLRFRTDRTTKYPSKIK